MDRKRALTNVGFGLLGFGGLLALNQSKPASTASSSGSPSHSGAGSPSSSGAPQYPVVVMGSAWVMRAGWVRDHGQNGPLYGADGSLVGWIAFGTRLQTTGPAKVGPQAWIGSDGSSCCPAGSFPMYPVSGGFVATIDVVPG